MNCRQVNIRRGKILLAVMFQLPGVRLAHLYVDQFNVTTVLCCKLHSCLCVSRARMALCETLIHCQRHWGRGSGNMSRSAAVHQTNASWPFAVACTTTRFGRMHAHSLHITHHICAKHGEILIPPWCNVGMPLPDTEPTAFELNIMSDAERGSAASVRRVMP